MRNCALDDLARDIASDLAETANNGGVVAQIAFPREQLRVDRTLSQIRAVVPRAGSNSVPR